MQNFINQNQNNQDFTDINVMPDDETEFVKIEDLPDGSSIYDTSEFSEGLFEEEENEEFYANICDKIDDSKLNGIAAQILEGIEQDKESRREWQQAYLKGMRYLGFKLEDFKDVPFMAACRAFDTTFSTSLLRFFSTYMPELFPEEGPVGAQVLGEKNDFIQEIADTIKDGLNYYLTQMDRDYYPDSERLMMFLALVGCAFKKVYQDPISNRPIARFIDPNNFLINNNCVTILSSSRLTHIEELTKKEIKLRQLSGFYRDMELPGIDNEDDDDKYEKDSINRLQGIDLDTYDKKGLYHIYESHVDLDDVEDSRRDADKNGLQKPYIVSICKTSRKVLSIRRNWREGDETFKRIEYFVQYNFIPGFGIYGLGLTQLLGSNAIVLTSLLRQLIDAGTFENFPGGLMVSGLRIGESNKLVEPGSFLPIETGQLSIQEAVMPLPYKGPSVVLKDLMNDLSQKTASLANTIETQIAEGNPNAPVGTTLALLEVSSKFQSAIFSSLRKSLGNELNLIYNLFKENLSENPFSFKLPGKSGFLTREHFVDDIVIIPNSDPKLTTSAQRIIYADAKLRTAQSAPQIHDMRQVYKGWYKAIGLSENEIDLIMPDMQKAVPLDPVTENMNAMLGKPLQASIEQDHDAHIMTHTLFAQDPNVQAHIKQHEAFKYLIEMQRSMGILMPQGDELLNPEVQNQIAVKAAEVSQQIVEQQQKQIESQQPIDPSQLVAAQIEAQRAKTISDEKIAHLKAEESAFETQMKFNAEVMKIEANKEIAEEKNERDLMLAEMKRSEV